MQWWMAGPIPEVRILFYPYAQQAYMGTGYTALSLPRTGRSGEGGNGEIRESTEALPFGSASNCGQTRKWNEIGEEDSAKETQEGCLSRSIRSFSNNFCLVSCSKNLLQRGDKILSTR